MNPLAAVTPLAAVVVAEAAALALAIARVGGFVLTSPFPGKNVPTEIKIGLILVLAFLTRSASPATALPSGHLLALDMTLLGLVPTEFGIGIVLGFMVRITFAAAEIVGANLAQSTGLTMGAVFDPTLGTEDPLPARMVSLLAMLLFFAMGAHRVALGYMLESFRALPIGQVASIGAAAPAVVDVLSQVTEAGLRLGLPVMGVALGVQLGLALVSRASPSLQIFNVGMGITVAAGVLTMMGALSDVSAGLGASFEQEGPRIERAVSDMVQR